MHNKGTENPGPSVGWLMQMAWRDSRRNRSRLFLFISSIILGIAALVSVQSLSDNLRAEIDRQAAALVGADLVISGNKPFTTDISRLADSLGDRRSSQKSFPSMAIFMKTGGTRLVQIRALEGEYPFYGSLKVDPETAGRSFRNSRDVLVDKGLLMQFNGKVGDSLQLGMVVFRIAGALEFAPGQTGLTSAVAPVIFMPMRYLAETGLEQFGSRISHTRYIKFDRETDIPALVEIIEDRVEKAGFELTTIERQQEQTSRSFRDVGRFLSLIGFVALLLGCIGVASAIHVYIREKIGTIAILRCLGATSRQAFLIYLFQILAFGLMGATIGAMLGSGLQYWLPTLLKDILPVEVKPIISWSAIGQGIGIGVVISVLFALAPLLSIRRISPLNTLRMDYQSDNKGRWSNMTVYSLILLFVWGFSWLQIRKAIPSLFFTLAVVLSFLILAGFARLLMWFVRRYFPGGWPYVWRQGLANLYRPQNQTTVLLMSIGLGTALFCTVLFIQTILLDRVRLSTSGAQPNIVVFDIQEPQRDSLVALSRRQGLPVSGTVPIVTMRLTSLNRIDIEDLRKDSSLPMRPWLFNREYRVTYRDTLVASERITKGKWKGRWEEASGLPSVSVEEGLARRNGIKIGDTLTFDVQGVPLPTTVGSFRQVEWNRIQTNFLVLFPSGVLEKAPKFHVLVSRVDSPDQSARYQREVIKAFPNVSIIDLGLVLDVVSTLLEKIGFIIRFMAVYCMATGIVVLIASVLISKYQRIRESVLLRTIGAGRRQILSINAIEYFMLGALAAITGILLALLGSWILADQVFETIFRPEWTPVLLVFGGVCSLTVLIGMANSRQVVNRPPLEVLRDAS
jgi:putative ABC transport system permease protein